MMPKFGKAEVNEPESLSIPAPVAERGMVVIKLAVPPASYEAMLMNRDSLQEWLNKGQRGELKHGDQFVIVWP
jgi:hypothetical protein